MSNSNASKHSPLSLYGEMVPASRGVHRLFEVARELLVLASAATGHTSPIALAIAVRDFMTANPGTGLAFVVDGKERIFAENIVKPVIAMAVNAKVVYEWDADHTHIVNIHVDVTTLDRL